MSMHFLRRTAVLIGQYRPSSPLGSLGLAVVMTGVLLVAPSLARAVDIQEVTSPGGITAWLVEDHKNPIITMTVSFAGGQSADPAGKEGLADMMSGLLDEGAGPLDSKAFQSALESNAISLSFDAGRDDFSASLSTLTETSEEAFRLMRFALTEPRFDPEPVARIKGQIVAGIRAREKRPRTIAAQTWWRDAFPDHPYGRPSSGSVDSVSSIESEDLKAFAKAILAREKIWISVVGDIRPDRLGAVLDRVFGALPTESGAPDPVPAAPANAGKITVIEQPIRQSTVVFGHRGLSRDDPDWYAASVLMEIMAGGFGSRLTEEVREKRGLTYGIFAFQLPLDQSALLRGGVSSDNARVAEAIQVLREIWADMAENGPTEQEVKDAKTYINGSFPLRLENSRAISGILTSVQRENLGIDYLAQRASLIDEPSMEDLRRVAKRLFLPEELSIVVVGNPEGLPSTQ